MMMVEREDRGENDDLARYNLNQDEAQRASLSLASLRGLLVSSFALVYSHTFHMLSKVPKRQKLRALYRKGTLPPFIMQLSLTP